MKQKTKKEIAKGMIASGLISIVFSTLNAFIESSNIQNLSAQRERVLRENNQIYYISKNNPSAYNQNLYKASELEKEIKGYKESKESLSLFLLGSPLITSGIYLYPRQKQKTE